MPNKDKPSPTDAARSEAQRKLATALILLCLPGLFLYMAFADAKSAHSGEDWVFVGVALVLGGVLLRTIWRNIHTL